MLNYLKFACFCVLSIYTHMACSADFQTKITYVYDGDTVKIRQGSSTYKLRISDIDAPERNQSYGKKARRALIKLCQHAPVSVLITGIDKYHRQLGQLQCNHQSVSHFMVLNGHAWHYQQYSLDPALSQAEATARNQKRGLWRQKKPTAPWIWRKQHSH